MQHGEDFIPSMTEQDLDAVLHWRNDPDVRRLDVQSRIKSSLEEHLERYARAQENPRRHLLIVEKSGGPRVSCNSPKALMPA